MVEISMDNLWFSMDNLWIIYGSYMDYHGLSMDNLWIWLRYVEISSADVKMACWKMGIEIVSFPIQNGGSFHSSFTRVILQMVPNFNSTTRPVLEGQLAFRYL